MTIYTTTKYPHGISRRTTFCDFLASERYSDNLNNLTGCDDDMQGYIYLDSFYVIAEGESDYIVHIGRSETLFDNLRDARKFLWNEFAKDESNPT